jgi:hypothetical protein
MNDRRHTERHRFANEEGTNSKQVTIRSHFCTHQIN